MKIRFCSVLLPMIFLCLISVARAQRGFSIEGGLIGDYPKHTQHDRPYTNMQNGIGYMAALGYDFIDRAGLELGVLHTSHNFEVAVVNTVVLEDKAEKTALFLKARAIPFKWPKAEIVAGLGVGFYDISGLRYSPIILIEEDFSGFGLITSLNFRYFVTPGLGVTFYLGANFVNYNKYTQFGERAPFSGRLPGGDSINIGVTIFHRIGIPQI